MFILGTVFLLGLLTQTGTKPLLQNNEVGDVIFVNLIYRHGERSSPLTFYPTDPYKNDSYWPEGIGQLTNVGKRQQYELGRWLRQRYDTLLTGRYSPDIIYIQSTDVDRALMSAQCNLAGMFPPDGSEVWNDSLAWQPIPIHTRPLELDHVIGWRVPCPAFTEELQRFFTSDDKMKQLNETYSELLRWTSENSGMNITLKNVCYIHDTFDMQRSHNLTLPEWTKKVYPEPMLEASLFCYLLDTWTPKLARLRTGLLLRDMITNMENKIQNKTTRNVHVYSAHDENIANFLNDLGAFNHIIPPHASCLMLELRVDSVDNHYVTLYYRNSTTEEPYLLQVAGCPSMCPLETFIHLVNPLIPEDWNLECNLPNANQNSFLTPLAVGGLAVVTIAVVIILVLAARRYYH